MDEDEKTEHLIVKIPPNDKADREMAQMAQVDRREIHFYTEALPQLEVCQQIPDEIIIMLIISEKLMSLD